MRARLKFSKKQFKRLPALQKEARMTANVILFRRASALLMLSLNATHQEIADSLGVCREVISRWLALFMARGANGLHPRKSPGRKSKLSPSQRKELAKQIQAGPKEWGYPGGVWTSAMIQEHIQKHFGVFYSVKYIPELLKNMGLSHIKPKYTFTLSKDELKKQIKWIRKTLPDLYKKVQEAGGVLLFEDETTCQLQPNVMATWAQRGNPPTEEKNPKRGHMRVLGTIELGLGKLLYSIFDGKKFDNTVFVKFLRQVVNHYKGREVFLVMDGATTHGGPAVRRFLEKNKQLHLIRQPAKSPNLNPIEKVWKELKKDRTRNVYFKDEAALKSALRKGLFALQQNPQRIRALMTKWEKVVSNPELALEGKYDSSLIPKKHKDIIGELRQEVSDELKKDMTFQETNV